MEPEMTTEYTIPMDPKEIIERNVTLNDGTKLEGTAYTDPEQDVLFVNLVSMDMMTAFPLFQDSEKTKKIHATIWDNNSHSMMVDNTFEGYTRMTQIQSSGVSGGVNVQLKHPLA